MPNPVHQEVQQNIFDLESEISSLEGRKRHLKKIILSKKNELQESPTTKKELDMLVQERDSSRRIYEQLLMSAGQSEVSRQMELGDKSTTFRIVDPAILPQAAVSPNIVRLIMMSIAAGFLLGGALVVGVDLLRGTVNSVDDIKTLGYTLLATIPTIDEPASVVKSRRKDMMVYCASFSYFLLVIGVLVRELLSQFK
jgi:succinoglycan biosynthesis transport protein ExoP